MTIRLNGSDLTVTQADLEPVVDLVTRGVLTPAA